MGPSVLNFDDAPITATERTLDEVLDDVGIVKLDIEGAEFGALQGLSRRPPAIVFEFADWAETRIDGQAAGSAQEFLLSLGYRLFPLGRGGKLGARLERPTTNGSTMILALPSSCSVGTKD